MIQGGIEIPFIQMAKRPDKVRVEGTFQALTFIQTYNGKEGWSLNPFAGVTDPQPMTEDELKGNAVIRPIWMECSGTGKKKVTL